MAFWKSTLKITLLYSYFDTLNNTEEVNDLASYNTQEDRDAFSNKHFIII